MITRKAIASFVALILGVFLSLALTAAAAAQDPKAKAKSKENRLSGTVHMIDKNSSSITLRKGNINRQVVYGGDTKFTLHNKPSSLDDVKEGRRLICLGTFDEKTRLVATRIDVRTENP
jgi:Cu/Ag efflux protein CusF